jgi:hypothetical protein
MDAILKDDLGISLEHGRYHDNVPSAVVVLKSA